MSVYLDHIEQTVRRALTAEWLELSENAEAGRMDSMVPLIFRIYKAVERARLGLPTDYDDTEE